MSIKSGRGMVKERIKNSRYAGKIGRFYLPGAKALLAVVLGLWLSVSAFATNFTASLDRDTITLGENATLSRPFAGVQPKNAPTPDVPGLEFTSTGNSSSFNFNNG